MGIEQPVKVWSAGARLFCMMPQIWNFFSQDLEKWVKEI
jgi:hypothetical protein